MNANDIKIGTKFEIEIPDYTKRNDESSTSYISQLLDIVDDKNISIVAPMHEGRLKFLSSNTKIVVYYLNSRQDLFCFNAIVKGHKKIGPLDMFDLTIVGDFTKIQRRRYYRLDVTLDCQYKVETEQLISSDNLTFSKEPPADLKNGYIKNISGSGLCLVLEEPLHIGSVLDITINLDESALIRVFAQIVRIISIQGKKHELGMHFVKIEKHDADTLNRFIFEKQRILLKNAMQDKMR